MRDKHHDKITIRTGAQGAATAALRTCEIFGELGRALNKTVPAIFHAPGPIGSGRGGHHGRAARIHGEHGVEHIVAARINHGFAWFRHGQQLGRKVGISPRLAITRHGGR
jgi:hypothetical protein